MASKSSDWRPGPTVCRCCLAEGCYKDISTEYFWMGKREVYAEMLLDALNLSIAYSQSGGPNSNSRLICELCITRLREASEFKRQVQECEKTFMQCLDPGAPNMTELDVTLENMHNSEVKVERVKLEKPVSDDDDFDDRPDFGDDDDDDLDDQPLTKFASKEPKKESVDILDLLDNSKAGVKRKSTSKTKTTPAKKVKLKEKPKKETVKPTTSKSKAPKPTIKLEKKKKGVNMAETSVWQLTVSERRNAATFIQYTSVRPFIFMGSTFKCFYCHEYFSDVEILLNHTSQHKLIEKDSVTKKYLPKGKRTLQVDISDLNCRLCGEKFHKLHDIKSHLEMLHGVIFSAGGNGMTEYCLEVKDGVLTCHVCSKTFHSFQHLNSHTNSHIVNVVCENCGAGFRNQHMLMKHKESHLNKKLDCKYCDKSYFKKSQLKYHTEIVHKGKARVKPKKCLHCSETFKEYYSKITHLREAHGITKTFQCHLCKSTFPSRRALTEHSNRYHTEKYKCGVCSKCFAIESRLKQHMRGHTGERNYVCTVCKNSYMHKMTLRKHMRSHSADFKFICVQCAAGFHTKNEYGRHLKQCHDVLCRVVASE